MKFFLRLKHWQLFLLTWGVPIAIDVFAFSKPELIIKLFPLMMICFAFGIFGWIWAIATELHPKLPEGVKLNVKSFKIQFSIPIIYIVIVTAGITYSIFERPSGGEGPGALVALLVIFHLISMVCILLGMRFAAKTIKSIELGRLARFGDYAGEFFLIWFSIIGFWFLQPRLNKLSE